MQANLDMNSFMREVEQHFIAHPPVAPRYAENQARLNTLVEDGIVILPNYVPRETVLDLFSKIAWLPSALKDGTLSAVPDKSKFAQRDWGLFRVYDVDTMYPEANVLKDDPVIVDIVQSYMANRARHTTSCVELRDTPGDSEALTEHMMPHFDSYYREVKVWLLLINVGMSQGPMRYYTKTHKFASWRAVPDYLRYLGGLWREASGVHPFAVRLLQEQSAEWVGVEKIYCTGGAGTVVIADTRGLHRAWPLEPGNIRLDMYSDYRMDELYEYR